jgi:ketosteroid isomerase-like protein
MNRSLAVIAAAVLCIVVWSCAPPKEKMEDVIAANKALDARYVDAFLKNNVDSIMSTYLNDSTIVELENDGSIHKGYNDIKSYYQNFLAGFEVVDGKLLEENFMVYDGVVVGYGKYWIKFRPKGGADMEITGRYHDVRAKVNGAWYYTSNAEIAIPPPAPAAAAETGARKE